MDRDLRRRYLRAMGVEAWCPRDGNGLAERMGDGAAPREPDGHRIGADSPASAAAVTPQGTAAGSAAADPVAGMDWHRLQEAVVSCRACELCETRTQTVFGVGDRQAQLMVIGEAPGADEDRQGEPFVGRAGQLLTLMLLAIGLKREQVFIANVLKCRPPGNRDPRPEEALRCEPFLMRQIALIRPQVLLSVGRISAQKLLKTDAPIGGLRGRWFAFGPDGTPLTVTYHPAYLLRSPDQKAKAWQDLLQVARRLRRPLESAPPRRPV
jgi:DNA polymerase